MESWFLVFADVVLIAHLAFVAFVVLGLVLIVIGGLRGWHWVRHIWFRLCHLVAIGIVAAQAWFGVICPLTTLEVWLRRRAGQAGYDGTFVQYWMHRVLYYDAPAWVFVAAYTIFGALVVIAMVRFPPQTHRHRVSDQHVGPRG
ncbi:MAG: DUF2784 domain-containing protein [Pseudomonadota bacterium]